MLGLSVIYTLTAADAEQINRRRTSRRGISERIAYGTWPLGAQAHIGNAAGAGQKFPGIVVRDWGRCQNLQVFLDGTDVLWVCSVESGDGEGKWVSKNETIDLPPQNDTIRRDLPPHQDA